MKSHIHHSSQYFCELFLINSILRKNNNYRTILRYFRLTSTLKLLFVIYLHTFFFILLFIQGTLAEHRTEHELFANFSIHRVSRLFANDSRTFSVRTSKKYTIDQICKDFKSFAKNTFKTTFSVKLTQNTSSIPTIISRVLLTKICIDLILIIHPN